MNLEITGKLISILEQVKGQGAKGEWVKQSFVIETEEQYPKKVCITAWSENVNKIQTIAISSTIKVAFRLESREYNGRWYTDVRAWKIDIMSAGSQPVSQNGNQASTMETVVDPLQNTVEAEDDLPF